MYVIRRVAKTEPGKEREVAALLTRICEAYEQAGHNKAQVYILRLRSAPNWRGTGCVVSGI